MDKRAHIMLAKKTGIIGKYELQALCVNSQKYSEVGTCAVTILEVYSCLYYEAVTSTSSI